MSPTGWRGRFLAGLAPGLLIVMALHQIALAHHRALSPWKGGGFGMFASTDHGEARVVRVWAIEAGTERRLSLPGAVTNPRYRARELPDETRLRRLARAVVAESGDELDQAASLRVEVWRTDYDRETLEPRLEPLRQRSFPVHELH